MARPTLSKVVYMQQIGRGTRKAPGKECLVVIDFVDNASRYNQSLNLHRVTGNTKYRPGGFVLAADDLMLADEKRSAEVNVRQRSSKLGSGQRRTRKLTSSTGRKPSSRCFPCPN